MANFKAVIAALLATDATKQLGAELKAELGDFAELDAGALRSKISGAESVNRKLIIERAFVAHGRQHGFNPAALKTALKVANLDKITVDTEKLEVTSGLNQEFFEGLKKEHSLFFSTDEALLNPARVSAANIPAMPPHGAGLSAAQPTLKIPGAVGGFIEAFKM